MNLGKDIITKRKILSYKQCSSPPIPLLSFILTCRSDCSRKISFAKKEGIRKVGEGGEIGTQCSSSPSNKNALRENERGGGATKHPAVLVFFLPY